MTITITKVTARDVRFPTSRDLDGRDAMNQASDCSAAYAGAAWTVSAKMVTN